MLTQNAVRSHVPFCPTAQVAAAAITASARVQLLRLARSAAIGTSQRTIPAAITSPTVIETAAANGPLGEARTRGASKRPTPTARAIPTAQGNVIAEKPAPETAKAPRPNRKVDSSPGSTVLRPIRE